MAKVVFLQQLDEEWLGVMYISSMLKSHGHQCDIFVELLEKDNMIRNVLSEQPDIIAASCLTSDYHWALRRVEMIRRHSDALIVFGGTHVTLNPAESISNPNIDIICVGEGEYPLVELADAIDSHDDFTGIQNLWLKKDGNVIRNDVRNLVEDLDSLPFPDRKLYTRYGFFQERGKRPVHLGRGCPYDCSHCHNSAKRAIYENKGKYIRRRSKENVLAEIDHIAQQVYIKVLHFVDDNFGANREWLMDFVQILSSRGGRKLALQGNMRADMVTDDLCEVLKEYGAEHMRLRIAVECGDEDYRHKILKKYISNQTLKHAADIFNRHKIGFITYNMIGLPGETFSQAMATLRLNCVLKPERALCFVYQPFPKTDLSNYALEMGFLTHETLRKLGTSEYEGFYHSKSPLNQEDIWQIENLHKIFGFVVGHPSALPIVRIICGRRWMAPLLQVFYKIYIRIVLLKRRTKDKY